MHLIKYMPCLNTEKNYKIFIYEVKLKNTYIHVHELEDSVLLRCQFFIN